MSVRFTGRWPLVLALCLLTKASDVVGQEGDTTAGGPRFLLAAWDAERELDASQSAVLRQRVSLDLSESTIGIALKEIVRQTDLELLYSPRVVPVARPLALVAQDVTVAAALTEILRDVPVDVSVTATGALAIIPNKRRAVVQAQGDTGVVTGRVEDAATGLPIVAATVVIEELSRTTTTNAAGQYRFGGLVPGTYAVRARYIGYKAASLTVTVRTGEDATANFRLAKSPQELDQLVVTGTIVPTEIKALPTPVSVIDEEDIALQRPRGVQELFRKAIPGAVSWVYSDNPYDTPLSVRGASSLTTSAPSMKIFIDGVEVASASYAQIDPQSIERVEVIRGPQAAAIYGSEAIGGVIQIFTKRGDPGLARPQVDAEAALGVVQTPYAGRGEVLRQEYKAAVRGGGSDVGFHVGAGYSHLDDWLPRGEISRQSSPSVYGAMNYSRGVVRVELSGRHYVQNGAINSNPDLLETGFPPFSKPNYEPLKFQNQTLGARVGVAPTSWWNTVLGVGVDRFSTDVAQTRPRLTTPADTLLLVSVATQAKTSLNLSTSVRSDLGAGVSGSVTAGIDHWNSVMTDWSAVGALTTTGIIRTPPEHVISATRIIGNNTGYFAQAQAGFRDAVFLTAGIRAEDNTEFGDSLGTPVSPRLGLAYVRELGGATLKLRSSWGRAIRPPGPGRKLGFVRTTIVQLPNPLLGPEWQQGWDAGIDATFGTRGSFSITYYDQVARNLADAVLLEITPVPTQQFQNVGRVRNTGIEIEARLALGLVTLDGQYAYSRARIEQLSPTYIGDLQVGDQARMRPRHTAGASLTVTPTPVTTLSFGLTYVGSWINSDALAQFRCIGGTGACLPSLRDYLIDYPSLVKINVSVFQKLTPSLSGFASIDNLTNNQDHEGTNFTAVTGRRSTLGLQLQY